MTAFLVDANAAFSTYSDLVAAINDWLDREDLNGVAGQMIALAEDEMRLRLEPYFLEASTSVVTDSSGLGRLPSDAKRVTRVIHNNRVLQGWGITSPDGEHLGSTPRGYTMEQGGIRVWPGGAYTLSVLYQPLLSRLTEAAPTNNLLSDFPSLYFYGAMVFAHGYVVDDERAARFRVLFDQQLENVARYYQKQKRSGPLKPYTPNTP